MCRRISGRFINFVSYICVFGFCYFMHLTNSNHNIFNTLQNNDILKNSIHTTYSLHIYSFLILIRSSWWLIIVFITRVPGGKKITEKPPVFSSTKKKFYINFSMKEVSLSYYFSSASFLDILTDSKLMISKSPVPLCIYSKIGQIKKGLC